MGVFLNSLSAYTLYKNESVKPYFVDKTRILEELFPLIEQGSNYVCITRPRRFGKTVMANMIAAFLGKEKDSHEIFDKLAVSGSDSYEKHINQHNVIHISFSTVPLGCTNFSQYIENIRKKLIKDLIKAYPDSEIDSSDDIWDIMNELHEYAGGQKFIFILDEWDYIFHRSFVTEQDKKTYLQFLNSLLKDKAYVSLAYMTGILPISKYSSGSELNMFLEYKMMTNEKYSEYFGFDDDEVDKLFQRYLEITEIPNISREGLRLWYDGYHTVPGKRIYNPRSVVGALSDNEYNNYWTSSGPYDEIFYYIENNVADVRDDIARMVSGVPVPAKVEEYAAVGMNLTTKNEIFSAMVVYGFLSYEKGRVCIPNKELMDKFGAMLREEPSLGYVHRLAKESERMLTATLTGDTATMLEILEYAHDTEIPLLSYNNEVDLTAVVNLVYLAARDSYRMEREDKAGIGYVDFIFYPERNKNDDCMILELKVNDTPEAAIRQIKDRKYALKFKGKLGSKTQYTGRILAVGIAYDKESKKHSCKIEVLE